MSENKTVFRRAKDRDNPFVMIDKTIGEKPTLSWKAKGIMLYLLSRPNDWIVRMTDLIKRSTDGAKSTRTGIHELLRAGYMTREQKRAQDGQWGLITIIVHEIPVPKAERTLPQKRRRSSGNRPTLPLTQNGETVKSSSPLTQKRLAVFPQAEKRMYTNTDLTNKDLTNIKAASESPENEEPRTYLGDSVATFERTRGHGSPTVPEDHPEGLDLFEFEPLIAFCELVGMDHNDLPQKDCLSWRRELRGLAQKTGTQPDQMAAAIRSFAISEYAWMSFTWPGQKSFKNTVMIIVSRLKNGVPLKGGSPPGQAAAPMAQTQPKLSRHVRAQKTRMMRKWITEGRPDLAKSCAKQYGLPLPAAD